MPQTTNNVGKPRLSRTKFRLKRRKLFDCDMGEMIPIQCDLVMPGDVLRVHIDIVSRTQPLIAPLLHQIDVETHTAFIPIRIVDPDFADDENGSLSGGVYRPGDPDKGADGLTKKTFPKWVPSVDKIGNHSLWDYFGLPTREQNNIPAGQIFAGPYPDDWIRRVYNKFYNDFFRAEHFEKEIPLTNEDILYRNYRKDYFTSAAPFRQEGPSPSVPLSGDAGATWNLIENFNKFIPNSIGRWVTGTAPLGASNGSTGPVGQMYYPIEYQNTSGGGYIRTLTQTPLIWPVPNNATPNRDPTYGWQSGQIQFNFGIHTGGTENSLISFLNNNAIDWGNVGTFDVNDLRDVIQQQKFLERNTRIGLRYVEQLVGRWNISPRDERLQRPEFIGGTRTPIIISEVLQTSETSDASPQGQMAGHGLAASMGRTRKYVVQEWGYIITLLSIMPKAGYSQGIPRQYIHESRYDFPTPEFMHTGEREIYQTELYTGTNEVANRAIWGYRPIYDEMRMAHDTICGNMRKVLNQWHLSREFATAPLLNQNFISTKDNIRKDVFADSNEKGFIVHAGIKMNVIRSMPRLGEPGLMDHF